MIGLLVVRGAEVGRLLFEVGNLEFLARKAMWLQSNAADYHIKPTTYLARYSHG